MALSTPLFERVGEHVLFESVVVHGVGGSEGVEQRLTVARRFDDRFQFWFERGPGGLRRLFEQFNKFLARENDDVAPSGPRPDPAIVGHHS